jgi:hypothetical protein
VGVTPKGANPNPGAVRAVWELTSAGTDPSATTGAAAVHPRPAAAKLGNVATPEVVKFRASLNRNNQDTWRRGVVGRLFVTLGPEAAAQELGCVGVAA